MGPLIDGITEEDKKRIQDLIEGKEEMPDLEYKHTTESKVIGIGTKVHPIGYRENLYGIVSKIKRGRIEVSFTHTTEHGGKASRKWFRPDMVCRFEDREKVYAEISKRLNLNENTPTFPFNRSGDNQDPE